MLTVLGEAVEFSVSPESGGELASLRVRRAGRWLELLYRGGAAGAPPKGRWRGRAPWLFPAVGRSYAAGRLGYWKHGGRVLPMPIHGFALSRAWQPLGSPRGTAACRLADDAASRRSYPFGFELVASYSAAGAGVRARLEVRASARNREPMPFSVGNHLTLALPFSRAGSMGACTVRAPGRMFQELTASGLLSGKTRPARLAKGVALESEPALANGVLGEFRGECWAEVSDPGAGLAVRVEQREVAPAGARPLADPASRRFVFWSDRRTFLCPEPWLGAPDSLNEGSGLVRLEPGQAFVWELWAKVTTRDRDRGGRD